MNTLQGYRNDVEGLHLLDAEGRIIAENIYNEGYADLFRAAPELLKTLKAARTRLLDLLDYRVDGEPIMRFIEAAIADAEGR